MLFYNKVLHRQQRKDILEKEGGLSRRLGESHADGVAHIRASYDKYPDSGAKSTARLKASISVYHKAIQLYHMHSYTYAIAIVYHKK